LASSVLLLLCIPLGAALVRLPAHGDANAWQRTADREVPLLPFPVGDGLLPGESLQIHLFEPHQLALFDASVRYADGCVGQLLECAVASSEAVRSYCAIAPLLELREHRSCTSIGGTWCSFTCVGAVRLSGVELRTADEQRLLRGRADGAAIVLEEAGRGRPERGGPNFPNSPSVAGLAAAGAATGGADQDRQQREQPPREQQPEPFLVAEAQLIREEGAAVDYDSADDEEAFLVSEVTHAHEEMNELRRRALSLNANGALAVTDRITSGGERIGPPPAADDRVEFGFRLGPLIGPFISLDELVTLRLEALCTRGMDEAPAGAGSEESRLLELWGSCDQEGLRRRLLSYVAVESLDEGCRVAAMGADDTSTRLQLALVGLRARRAALAAEVALRQLGESNPDAAEPS